MKALPLILAGVIGALVVIEGVFRVWEFVSVSPPAWNDRPRTYFAHENSKSFQDYPYSLNKPEGTFRIAVVGDSFTFGPYLQINDTFPKRLEHWLNLNSSQPKVEIINYGVPRYSTSHEVAITERALNEGADLIILQITLNDPELKPYRPTGLDSRYGDRFAVKTSRFEWLYDYWRSLGFVVKRWNNSKSRQRYYRYFTRLFSKKETWNGFSESLTKIAELAKGRSVPLVAVVFPLFGFPNDNQYPFWPIHDKILHLLKSLELPALDLFERYRDIPLERLTVIPGADRHPNEIAHRIAAEAIYEWLVGLKLVPPESVAKVYRKKRVDIRL